MTTTTTRRVQVTTVKRKDDAQKFFTISAAKAARIAQTARATTKITATQVASTRRVQVA